MDISYSYTTTTARSTSTVVTASANPSFETLPVTLTATVSPAPTGGTVSFQDGSSAIAGCASQAVDASGTATCTTAALAPGSHSITAVYGGDGGDQGSTSSVLQEQITADTPRTWGS